MWKERKKTEKPPEQVVSKDSRRVHFKDIVTPIKTKDIDNTTEPQIQ